MHMHKKSHSLQTSDWNTMEHNAKGDIDCPIVQGWLPKDGKDGF